MKKLLVLLPILTMMLAGCGGNNPAGGTGELLVEYDFTSREETSKEQQDYPNRICDSTEDFFNECAVSGAEHLESAYTTKVTSGGGKSGAHEYGFGFLKYGTSSEEGYTTFTFDEPVSKVVVKCHSFFAKSDGYDPLDKIDVNGESVLCPYNETATGEDVTFEIEASSEVKITSTGRVKDDKPYGRMYVWNIKFYK